MNVAQFFWITVYFVIVITQQLLYYAEMEKCYFPITLHNVC